MKMSRTVQKFSMIIKHLTVPHTKKAAIALNQTESGIKVALNSMLLPSQK